MSVSVGQGPSRGIFAGRGLSKRERAAEALADAGGRLAEAADGCGVVRVLPIPVGYDARPRGAFADGRCCRHPEAAVVWPASSGDGRCPDLAGENVGGRHFGWQRVRVDLKLNARPSKPAPPVDLRPDWVDERRAVGLEENAGLPDRPIQLVREHVGDVLKLSGIAVFAPRDHGRMRSGMSGRHVAQGLGECDGLGCGHAPGGSGVRHQVSPVPFAGDLLCRGAWVDARLKLPVV